MSKAEEIFARHLSVEAPEPVNVDSGETIFACTGCKAILACTVWKAILACTVGRHFWKKQFEASFEIKIFEANVFKYLANFQIYEIIPKTQSSDENKVCTISNTIRTINLKSSKTYQFIV